MRAREIIRVSHCLLLKHLVGIKFWFPGVRKSIIELRFRKSFTTFMLLIDLFEKFLS